MPTLQEHKSQAEENLALHDHLAGRGEHLDWALVTLAYSALQYVDAYLAPYHPADHSDRYSTMKSHDPLRLAFRWFRVLMERSEDARYQCYDPTLPQLQTHRKHLYEPVVAAILPHLTDKE
jgi:hypothetical protein